jgi:hypothetical protein
LTHQLVAQFLGAARLLLILTALLKRIAANAINIGVYSDRDHLKQSISLKNQTVPWLNSELKGSSSRVGIVNT